MAEKSKRGAFAPRQLRLAWRHHRELPRQSRCSAAVPKQRNQKAVDFRETIMAMACGRDAIAAEMQEYIALSVQKPGEPYVAASERATGLLAHWRRLSVRSRPPPSRNSASSSDRSAEDSSLKQFDVWSAWRRSAVRRPNRKPPARKHIQSPCVLWVLLR